MIVPSRSVLAALALATAAPARAGAPLTLDDALALAARQNPDLAQARADARSAGADRTASVAGVLPRLDLQTTAGRTFIGAASQPRFFLNPVTNQVEAVQAEATNSPAYSLGLQLSQPIVDWGAFSEVSRSGFSQRAAERQLDEVGLGVAFDVTSRFYEVVRAERTLDVLEKTVARSRDVVQRTDALFAAGRTPRSETFAARTNLGNDLLAAERQRAVVVQARTALAQVLGRADDGSDLTVVAPADVDAPGVPTGEPPPVVALLDVARARRPAISAQRALVSAADAGISTARAGYLPTISAQAAYARTGDHVRGPGGVYDDLSREYQASAQVVLTWNLFEGRRTWAGVQRAEAAAERARAGEARTVEGVAKELADARAVLLSRMRQVALASDNLKTAQQGLALARVRLDAGLATQLELRDASLKLTQAELALLEARIDHAVARAALARAAGGAV